MAKKSISSVDLAALVNEMQILIKGKVSQIYQQEKKELLFQLHAVGKGKKLLKIIPGKFLCFTDEKNPPVRPSGFSMQLRKYLDNAFIKSIWQKDAQRIIVFELEKKEETFFLIVELFSKGNIILTDKDFKIIGNLENQIWKDRVIKAHEIYRFPEADINWKELTESKLNAILQASEKKNLATSLATEVGLGGTHAEEICFAAKVDKNKLPTDISKKESKELFKELKELIRLIDSPSGFVYENEITPYQLHSIAAEKIIKKTKTFHEAINTIDPFVKASPYEKKINGLQKTISEQEQAITQQEDKIVVNTQKGELVYEKYSQLQQLLNIVADMKKSKTWNEIGKELKKEKKIKSVNLKEKKIVISL